MRYGEEMERDETICYSNHFCLIDFLQAFVPEEPMSFTTLIAADELSPHIGDPDWAIVDCRFALLDADYGWRSYEEAHIAGAIYAHLDKHLSGTIIPGTTGRHPLPDIDTFARTLSSWGINARTQVVAYDDMGGAMAAARLWWMLRWLGHEAVAVLDGGWQAWQQAGYPAQSGVEVRSANTFTFVARPRHDILVSADDVLNLHMRPDFRLIDARPTERYRGENETIDPVAGHIPGAVSLPIAPQHTADGRFLSPEELRARYQSLIDAVPAENVIMYCGSGVAAAHNVLALRHAGLGDSRLYAGSWSEWITNSARPIECP